MSPLPAERIIEHLTTVGRLRALREADAELARRVLALKTYQAGRFELTYADLLASSRYQAAQLAPDLIGLIRLGALRSSGPGEQLMHLTG